MAASTEVLFTPESVPFIWERPEGVVRFTEFTLSLAPPYRQIDLKYENPFCRLAARTASGAQLCGQGCGMDCGAQPTRHACPFRLVMFQAPAASGAGAARWVGRRFPNVEAMHEALDLLHTQGFDEDVLLAHLPPNPVAPESELREALTARRDGVICEVPVRPTPEAKSAERGARSAESSSAECGVRSAEILTSGADAPVRSSSIPAPSQPASENSSSDVSAFRAPHSALSPVADLLEYLEQVHRLIAGADRAETVCERFLRAVDAVVPFDEMAIYLRGRAAADWVITAAVGRNDSPKPRPQVCHLEPFGLGSSAIAQHRILMRRADKVESFLGRLEGEVTLALPFPLGGGELQGVWLAHHSESPRPCALGSDVVRYMRLLSEFLAARLSQIEELSEAKAQGAEPEPALALADALCREVARASRHNQPFTLLCLQARGRAEEVELPSADLTREFTAILRPYDTLIGDPESPCTWFAVLPHAIEPAARLVAARLMTVFEDVMDARGGTEEQGLRLCVGASVWGVDTIGAEEMIVHASGAALQAESEAFSSIQFYSAAPAVEEAQSAE